MGSGLPEARQHGAVARLFGVGPIERRRRPTLQAWATGHAAAHEISFADSGQALARWGGLRDEPRRNPRAALVPVSPVLFPGM